MTRNVKQAAQLRRLRVLAHREDRIGELFDFDTTETFFNKRIDACTLDYTFGRFG